MKKIYITILLIMLFSSISTPINGITKIQLNENWVYVDGDGKQYNETNLENFVFTDNGFARVNTTRAFPFEYYQVSKAFSIDGTSYANLDIDLITEEGNLLVTQTGGLPIYHDRVVSGVFNFTTTLNNGTTLSFVNTVRSSINWQINGEVEGGLVSGTPTRFSVSQGFNWTNYSSVSFTYEQLMSSFETNNFTIQYERLEIYYNLESPDQQDVFNLRYDVFGGNVSLVIIKENGKTILNKGFDANPLIAQTGLTTAYMIQLQEGKNVPIYVQQTEPVTVISGLSLNQLQFQPIEYFLQPDIIETTTSSETLIEATTFSEISTETTTFIETSFITLEVENSAVSFPFIFSLIILVPILLVYRKWKKKY